MAGKYGDTQSLLRDEAVDGEGDRPPQVTHHSAWRAEPLAHTTNSVPRPSSQVAST